MRVAFYKGTRKGFSGIYSRGVRYIEKGKYSHCELVFSNGLSASASFLDGGVRFKDIKYSTESDWDFVDVSWADESKAYDYFKSNLNTEYDVMGNLHFLFGVFGDSRDKKFCSEAVAEALGIKEAWLLAPNALYNVLVFINKEMEKQKMKLNFAEQAGEGEDSGHGNEPPKKPPVTPPPTTP